jgi:hypothetical protein
MDLLEAGPALTGSRRTREEDLRIPALQKKLTVATRPVAVLDDLER